MNKPTHREFEIKLPMRFRTSRKKVTALNLNVYRNLHYRSLTALKHRFQDHSKKLLSDHKVPKLGRIQLSYQVFARTRREFDVANICSIVDKFFSDSLIHAGVIEDDNWKFLDKVSFGFGGFTDQEHVLVTITEIEPRKGNVMRILLEEDEIQQAMEDFVKTLNLTGNVSGVELSVDDDGNVIAEVMMGDTTTAAKPRATRKGKGGRPAGSKNKPKEPEDDVEVSGKDSDADDDAGDADSSEDETSTDKTDTPAKSKEGSASKNLFGDEDDESSKSDAPEKDEDEGDTQAAKPKKSSIFDQ